MPVVLAPAEVLAGLIAICVLLCAYLIAQIGSAIFNAVPLPFIGSKIADAFSWLATHVLSAMGWLWDKTNPVAVFTALVNVWHDTEQGLHQVLFGDVSNALQWLYHTAIPSAAGWTLAQVHATYDTFVAGVNQFIGQVLAHVAWVNGQVAGLWHSITAVIPGQIAAAVGGVLSELRAAEGVLVADVAAAEQLAAHSLAVAIAGIEAWTGSQIGTAVGVVEGDLARVRDLVTGAVIPELAILSRVLTQVGADVVKVEECTAGICSSGTGNILGDIGKVLQELAPLIEGGLLFALVAEAVRDPGGVAGDIELVVGGTVGEAATIFRDVVGIAA